MTMRTAWCALALAALIGCGGAPSTPSAPQSSDPLATVSGEELFERGVALAQAEDYIRAEQYFVAAIQRGYDEDRIMPRLLAACVRSSRISAALSYAEPYLERHPEAWSLRLLVATLHMGLGETEQAHAHLLRVIEDRPEEPSAHYMLGVLARDALRDTAAARAAFARYLALEPEGPHAEEARASLRGTRGESGAAAMPVRLPSHEEEAR